MIANRAVFPGIINSFRVLQFLPLHGRLVSILKCLNSSLSSMRNYGFSKAGTKGAFL